MRALAQLWFAAARWLRAGHTAEFPHIDYSYAYHGEDWELGECGSRERQSPIDFGNNAPWSDLPLEGRPLFFSYEPLQQFNLQANGHSLAVDVAGEGFGGVLYDYSLPSSAVYYSLLSISLHAQSEHTFRGMHMPLELHLVHKADGRDGLVVVAVPVVGADEAPATLLDSLVHASRPEALGRHPVHPHPPPDINGLLEDAAFFQYDGSMTVPPCAPAVTWLVRREPVPVSHTVLGNVSAALMSETNGFGNYRHTLPLGDRKIQVRKAVRGMPPVTVRGIDQPIEPHEVFAGTSAARAAKAATLSANMAVRELDAKLIRGSRAHLAITGSLADEAAPEAPVAAQAAKVAESTLRSIANEIGEHAAQLIPPPTAAPPIAPAAAEAVPAEEAEVEPAGPAEPAEPAEPPGALAPAAAPGMAPAAAPR